MVAADLPTRYLKKMLAGSATIGKLPELAAKIGVEVKESNSKSISIDVTPDRPDLLCVVGLARGVRNFTGRKSRLQYAIQDQKPYLEIVVGRRVKTVRPFISGLVVRGLKFDDDSLKDLINFTEKLSANVGRKRKKLAMGLHNLDAIEPPLLYDAFKNEKFVPLGGKVPVDFKQTLESHKKGQEYSGTIGGSAAYPALKDSKGIMSLIPIINSERTKIDSQTKNIFLDITGTSSFLVEKIADMMASYFLDIGAEVHKVAIVYQNRTEITPAMKSEKLEIPMAKLDMQLGAFTHSQAYGALANKMGFGAAIVGNKLRVYLPAYRIDVINDQDIASDITVAYGYDRIRPLPVFSMQQGLLQKSTVDYEEIAQLMIGMGFSEAMNSYLTDVESNFRSMRMEPNNNFVKLKGSRVQSITMLRTCLLPSLLRNCGKSKHDSLPQRLFELDMAFSVEHGMAKEEQHLAAISVDPAANFNEAVAVIGKLLDGIMPGAKFSEHDHPSFIPGRSGNIIAGKREIGRFGELHPEVLSNFGIEEPAFAFELNLSGLHI